jgi:hypothetical protein
MGCARSQAIDCSGTLVDSLEWQAEPLRKRVEVQGMFSFGMRVACETAQSDNRNALGGMVIPIPPPFTHSLRSPSFEGFLSASELVSDLQVRYPQYDLRSLQSHPQL